MSNGYWIELANEDGFALFQTFVSRTKQGADRAFMDYQNFTDDDPKGTVEVRLTRNGELIDSFRRPRPS